MRATAHFLFTACHQSPSQSPPPCQPRRSPRRPRSQLPPRPRTSSRFWQRCPPKLAPPRFAARRLHARANERHSAHTSVSPPAPNERRCPLGVATGAAIAGAAIVAHRCLRAQDVSQWIHKESADISALYKKIPKPASGNKEEKLKAATDPQLKKMRSTLRECHRCARRAAKLSSRLRRPQPSAARLPHGFAGPRPTSRTRMTRR